MNSTRILLVATILYTSTVAAGEGSAPSSHMVYNDASFPGDVLINQVRVPVGGRAVPTYYEALGWSGKAGGYAGIQAHPQGHNFIFSIWDHDSHAAPIQAVTLGPGTKVEKFGGEGTGLKSMNFKLGWQTGVWYTLVARCWAAGDHTFYGFWAHSARTQEWTHLVTMDVAAKEAWMLGGNDSFIEDWAATGEQRRAMNIRNGWKRKLSGEWHPFAKARYSVNSWDLTEGKRSYEYRTNWNGGVAEDATGRFYFMVAGGKQTAPDVKNPSEFSIRRDEKRPDFTAARLTSATWTQPKQGIVEFIWTTDPKTVPLAGVVIEAVNKTNNNRLKYTSVSPDARTGGMTLPDGTRAEELEWQIRVHDIFGNVSAPYPMAAAVRK